MNKSQTAHAGWALIRLCVYVSAEALRLQSEALWIERGHRSAQLEELMRSLEQWTDVTSGQHDEAKLQGAYLNVQSDWALIENSKIYAWGETRTVRIAS